jgi:hypothetical protein
MYSRVKKTLIGKNVDGDATILYGSTCDLAEGEIVVLDKNKNILAPGSTVADSEFIYVAQGTGATYDYVTETGVSVTGVRKMTFSAPIYGNKVSNYSGLSYVAKAEKVLTVVCTATADVIAAGNELKVRIVYKDIKEHPGQFTHSYSIITTNVIDTDMASLVSMINKDPKRRISAAYTSGSDTLVLTGLAIPDCTTSLTDINEFRMVDFEVFITYIDNVATNATYGKTLEAPTTSFVYSGGTYGKGTWEQVRDMEKSNWNNEGVSNRIQFPVLTPDMFTAKSATYDQITIDSAITVTTPDNGYKKDTFVQTIVYMPAGMTGSNATTLLSVLNPYMESAGQGSITI